MTRSYVSRREFLKLPGTGAIGMSLLAGCSELTRSRQTHTETPTVTPTETPTETATETPTATSQSTYSYEPITGTWTGETNQPRHDFAKVEIMEGRATVGDEVGTAQLLQEDDTVRCSASLSAQGSNPPRFWVGVEGTDFPCDQHDRYRFQRKSEDRMRWFVYSKDGGYKEVTPLDRKSG